MKKWLIGLCVVGVLGFAGFHYGKAYLSEMVMDRLAGEILAPEDIEELKKDPEVRKIVEESLGAEEAAKLYEGLEQQQGTKPGSSSGQQSAASSGAGAKPSPVSTAGTGAKPSASSAAGSSSSPPKPAGETEKPAVMSKEEALSFMLKKFSAGELKSMAEQAKDGLTDAEKAEIANKLTAKMTPAELEQIKVAALVELIKKDAK